MSTEDRKRRISASIADLIEKEPTSKSEMIDWYDKAKKVKSLMELDRGDLQVPHALWHYLDDADIRLKDQRYAESQVLMVKEVLRTWIK